MEVFVSTPIFDNPKRSGGIKYYQSLQQLNKYFQLRKTFLSHSQTFHVLTNAQLYTVFVKSTGVRSVFGELCMPNQTASTYPRSLLWTRALVYDCKQVCPGQARLYMIASRLSSSELVSFVTVQYCFYLIYLTSNKFKHTKVLCLPQCSYRVLVSKECRH